MTNGLGDDFSPAAPSGKADSTAENGSIKFTDGIPPPPVTATTTYQHLPQPEYRINLDAKTLNGANNHQHSNGGPLKRFNAKKIPWTLVIFAAVATLLLLILLLLVFQQFSVTDSAYLRHLVAAHYKSWTAPNSGSLLARFRNVAVVSDNGLCSEIGRSTLMRGGNAVDAAIATAICVGALNSHSSGIGGGFLMVFYSRFYGKCSTIDARESAPLATNSQTFVNNSRAAFAGYKSIATPGEVYGYWTAYKRFGSGRINWQNLFTPTINYLQNGYPVTKLMETNLEARRDEILAEPTMSKFFINKATNQLYREGEFIRNAPLAETLRRLAISTDPIRMFYGGDFAKLIADEIALNGGYLTPADLESYRAIVDDSPLVNANFSGGSSDADEEESAERLAMCGPKAPSSFAITQLIVAIMSKLYPPSEYRNQSSIPYTSAAYYHRFIEAQKFAFALRTKLGDPQFVKDANRLAQRLTDAELVDRIVERMEDAAEHLQSGDYQLEKDVIFEQPADHGTSQVSVVDADGNAVSMTASINNVFGAMVRSERTGIIWNNQMDDFGIVGLRNFFGFEAAPANWVAPGKRPMSSMSPMIVYDRRSKNVRLAVGASGGSKIISAVAQVVLQTLNFNNTVKEAIDMPRIHNQFTPFVTEYESGFSTNILDELRERGQNLTEMRYPFANVHAIRVDQQLPESTKTRNSKMTTTLSANSDYRRLVYTYPTGY